MKLTKPASSALSPKKLFPVRLGWMVALALIAGITIGAVGTWLLAEQVDQLRMAMTKSSVQEPATNVLPQEDIEVTSTTSIQEDSNIELPELVQKNTLTDAVNLEVAWIDPVMLSRDRVRLLFSASAAIKGEELKARNENEFIVADRILGIDKNFYGELEFKDAWMAGKVKNGADKGGEIYILSFDWNTMGGGTIYQYFLRRPNSDRLIAIVDDEIFGIVATSVENVSSPEMKRDGIFVLNAIYTAIDFASDVDITSLRMPSTIQLQNGKELQEKEFSWLNSKSYRHEHPDGYYRFLTKDRDGRDLFFVNVTPAMSSISGCLIAFAPDGLAYVYTSMIPTKKVDEYNTTPDIRWSGDVRSDDTFNGNVATGCGGSGCAHVVSDDLVGPIGDLVVVGTTSQGESIYMPKDRASHVEIQKLYDTWYSRDGQKTMEDFLREVPVPIFFWRDALTRWVMYHSNSAVPAAECGKPVIYLYPEKATDVRVSLPKFINVTVSDPAYPSKGWVVTANPNGDLVSHADGKTYGSLFWEGTGVSYQVPTTGFVVKREDVGSFLAFTLPKYGLNQKESQEFMDFWVPRMASSSYYQVSFLTDTWSKAAPLNVFPRPKTSIRIFMDLKPLSAPISIKAPTIVTPKRDGFTLVEWGGLLY